jgi:hypothetical protein
MLNYEDLCDRMARLRADVREGKASVYDLYDAVETMYEPPPHPTTRPSRQRLLELIIEHVQWWCVRHDHDFAKLMVSWTDCRVVLHKKGTATISLCTRRRDQLMTYHWHPRAGFMTNEFREALLSPKQRREYLIKTSSFEGTGKI